MTSEPRDPQHQDELTDGELGPVRLAKAMELFLEQGAIESPEQREEFLRRHEDYRDLLEPMFEDDEEPDEGLAAQAATIEPGRQVGDYRIVRQVGRGGMGTVFEAEQISLRRRVALKVLQPHLSLSPDSIERFRREATSVAGLHHPGIVPIYEVGEWNGVHFFSMEFIDGTSLKDLVHEPRLGVRNSCTRAVESAELVARVADALHHAHEHDLIHRDVKPHNIMVCDDGAVQLLDFGLVKNLTEDSHSVAGGFFGTPHYSSPEQSEGSRPLGPSTDVFSLGIVLYELLARRRPFEGETSRAVLDRIEAGEFEPLSQTARSAPRDLRTICHKALELDPAQRYPTAGEMAADLRRFLRLEPIQARPPAAWSRAWKWTRRHRVRVALWSLAGLLLVGGPTGYAWHVHSTNEVMRRERRILRQAEDFSFHGAEQTLDLICQQLDRAPGLLPADRVRVDQIVRLCDNFLALRSQDPARRLRVASASLQISQVYERMQEFDLAMQACDRVERILASGPSLGDQEGLIRVRLIRRRLCLQQTLDPLVASQAFEQAMHQWRSELPTASGKAAVEYAGVLLVRARALADLPKRRPEAEKILHEVARLLGDDAQQTERARRTFLESRVVLATVHVLERRHEDAIAVVEPALAEFQKLAASPWVMIERAAATVTLGLARHALGATSEAEQLLRSGLKDAETGLQQFPGNRGLRRTVLRCRLRLSVWLIHRGKVDEAMAFAEGIRSVPPVAADDVWLDRYLWAQLAVQRGVCLLVEDMVGNVDQAAPRFEEAVAAFERLVAEQPDQARFHTELGSARNNLAAIANEGGRHEDAEALARQAIAAQQVAFELAPKDPWVRRHLGMHHSQLALACATRGDANETLRAVAATAKYVGRDLASLRLAAEAACRCATEIKERDGTRASHEHIESCQRTAVQVLRRMASFEARVAKRWLGEQRFASLQERKDFRQLVEELK